MTLQSSGALTASDIADEFEDDSPTSLSEFYGVIPALPASGAISFSDFYGVSSLAPWEYATTTAKDGSSVTHQSYSNLGLSTRSGYDLYALVICWACSPNSQSWTSITADGTNRLSSAVTAVDNNQEESRATAIFVHPVASDSTNVAINMTVSGGSVYRSIIIYFEGQTAPAITDSYSHSFPSSFNETTTTFTKTHTKDAEDYVLFVANVRGIDPDDTAKPTGFDEVYSDTDGFAYSSGDGMWITALRSSDTSVAINETIHYGQQANAISFVLDI
jgi:hypothetical protein